MRQRVRAVSAVACLCAGLCSIAAPATAATRRSAQPAAAAAAPPAPAPAPAPGKFGAARTVERQQALMELDDADTVRKLGAMEDILNSGDGLLIELAEKKILAGVDKVMRGWVLRRILGNANHPFTFEFTRCGGNNCVERLRPTGGVIRLSIEKMNFQDGTFIIYAPRWYFKNNTEVFLGKITDETMRFALDLRYGFNGGGLGGDFTECSGKFTLASARSMAGTIQCGQISMDGSFDLF